MDVNDAKEQRVDGQKDSKCFTVWVQTDSYVFKISQTITEYHRKPVDDAIMLLIFEVHLQNTW